MKIYISYFYQIRFFTRNMIPLSTAVFDPAWYHEMTRDQKHKFIDKRGVWNGLRAEPFMPGPLCEGMCYGPESCREIGQGRCEFLSQYYRQLKALDFNEIMARFEKLGKTVQSVSHFFEEPIPVLIVHETPDNPCSERWIIKQWFADNGYELKEWNRNELKEI